MRAAQQARSDRGDAAQALLPAPAPNTQAPTSDAPWSTWAMTDMLRMLVGLSMSPRICSVVNFTMVSRCPRLTLYEQGGGGGEKGTSINSTFQRDRAVGAAGGIAPLDRTPAPSPLCLVTVRMHYGPTPPLDRPVSAS